VLAEVLTLFPSQLIHIGGDECPKKRWEECEKCQKRIKENGLKNEHELQSYFIRRVEKYLNDNNRTLIGWDEILEGGLAPNAIVMSWRGMKGGIAAAKEKHYVIMSPTSHCYFDYYQGEPDDEPLAIGGYTPLKKVYSFEPVPEELSEDEAEYILGAQANVWAEYMPYYKHVEYMVTPRMSALSEVVWCEPENRNWEEFQQRIKTQVKRFEAMNVNYSKGSSRTSFIPHFNKEEQQLSVELQKEMSDITIHYTTDGSEPTLSAAEYKGPIPIDKTSTIKTKSFIDGDAIGKTYEQEIIIHKAVGAKVNYTDKYKTKYSAGGDLGLVDGILAHPINKRSLYQGFEGVDMEAIIDLGQETEISKVTIGFLHYPRAWIFRPNTVKIYTSANGKDFVQHSVMKTKIDIRSGDVEKEDFILENIQIKAKFIKVFAAGVKENPEWHDYPGEACWTFADEIIVE